MNGTTFIDGIDIFTEFGVFVSDGGYNGIVAYPSLKEPEKNDWHEEDGIEVDLSDPKLDSKTFEMSFGITDFPNVESLITLLSDGAYHTFYFTELEITRSLRLISHPNNKVKIRIGLFSLQFADDFPLDGFVPDIKTPTGNVCGFEIDDFDLLDSYGIYVLEGTEETFRQAPDVKENLAVNTSVIDGLVYDDYSVTFKHKEFGLKCLLLASIVDSGRYWWQDYYNLLYALSQPDERILNAPELVDEEFYYKSANIDKLRIVKDKVWIEFTLNLVFTSFRSLLETILITESDEAVQFEDEDCLIDMS